MSESKVEMFVGRKRPDGSLTSDRLEIDYASALTLGPNIMWNGHKFQQSNRQLRRDVTVYFEQTPGKVINIEEITPA